MNGTKIAHSSIWLKTNVYFRKHPARILQPRCKVGKVIVPTVIDFVSYFVFSTTFTLINFYNAELEAKPRTEMSLEPAFVPLGDSYILRHIGRSSFCSKKNGSSYFPEATKK